MHATFQWIKENKDYFMYKHSESKPNSVLSLSIFAQECWLTYGQLRMLRTLPDWCNNLTNCFLHQSGSILSILIGPITITPNQVTVTLALTLSWIFWCQKNLLDFKAELSSISHTRISEFICLRFGRILCSEFIHSTRLGGLISHQCFPNCPANCSGLVGHHCWWWPSGGVKTTLDLVPQWWD